MDNSIVSNKVDSSWSWVFLISLLFSNTRDNSGAHKLSKGGIPLANGDALLAKPPSWAFPLWTTQEVYRNSTERMSSSTAQAIDQVMGHKADARVKFVSVNLSVEKNFHVTGPATSDILQDEGASMDLEWVSVVLTADPGVRVEDIEDQRRPRRKEHRRVPSTIAIEEVKVIVSWFLLVIVFIHFKRGY